MPKVIGTVAIIGVLVFVWAMAVFNGGAQERAIAAGDLEARQEFQDDQAYDNIIANPYSVPSADWNLDGKVDPADLTYFNEVVSSDMPYDAVRALAREVADSTYPEIAAERLEG